MKHTQECNRSRFDQRVKRKAYEDKWPHFCKACDALGGVSFGGGYDQTPDFDICSVCEGKCPRCGDENQPDAFHEGGKLCSSCGWDWENPDVAPADPDQDYCGCDMVDTP